MTKKVVINTLECENEQFRGIMPPPRYIQQVKKKDKI